MFSKLVSLTLVGALIITSCATSAFASSNVESTPKKAEAQLRLKNEPGERSMASEKLRADLSKLVANAKAGKVAPPERSPLRPVKGNNLSKGEKIAIGVGIGVGVLAVLLVIWKRKADAS